jgi:hypothetical protein
MAEVCHPTLAYFPAAFHRSSWSGSRLPFGVGLPVRHQTPGTAPHFGHASSRTDIVLLDRGRVVVLPCGRTGKDQDAMRWKIETFHKMLKSGCKAEESRLRTAEHIINLIAVLCILS